MFYLQCPEIICDKFKLFMEIPLSQQTDDLLFFNKNIDIHIIIIIIFFNKINKLHLFIKCVLYIII